MEFVHFRLLVKNLLRDEILIGHALENDTQAVMIDQLSDSDKIIHRE